MGRVLMALVVLVVCGCWHVSSLAEDASPDSETDGATCTAGGNWNDEATGLCWVNPPSTNTFTWDDAVAYCDGLSLGGFDDWRLPLIQELISLLRGCVNGTATGDLSASDCGVTDPDCLGYECGDACNFCDYLTGPDDDPDGCYWVPGLEGTCGWYWSSSHVTFITSTWNVVFSVGNAEHYPEIGISYARCVRGGPWD